MYGINTVVLGGIASDLKIIEPDEQFYTVRFRLKTKELGRDEFTMVEDEFDNQIRLTIQGDDAHWVTQNVKCGDYISIQGRVLEANGYPYIDVERISTGALQRENCQPVRF